MPDLGNLMFFLHSKIKEVARLVKSQKTKKFKLFPRMPWKVNSWTVEKKMETERQVKGMTFYQPFFSITYTFLIHYTSFI